LANIALHVIDAAWANAAGLGTLVRYADDFVVLTTSRSRAEEAKRRIEAVLVGLGLRLHPDKTRIVFIGDGKDGFDFLGHADLRVMPTPRRSSLSGAAIGLMRSA
jgi:retron-type reverse transcriptase